MVFSRRLFVLLVVGAGVVYTIESTVPFAINCAIEQASKEREVKEETESLAPTQIESSKSISASIKLFKTWPEVQQVATRPSNHIIFPSHSRVILHRALQI